MAQHRIRNSGCVRMYSNTVDTLASKIADLHLSGRLAPTLFLNMAVVARIWS